MSKTELASGLNFHYEQLGAGPDVVLIHGLGGNLATWHFNIVPLLWDRYRCLTYDLKGHGYSDPAPTGYNSADQATGTCPTARCPGDRVCGPRGP